MLLLLLYRPIDFREAFDRVSHPKLIARLASYGIYGNLLSWLREYLSGLSHCTIVHVRGDRSVFAPMLSGIIQGGVIGRLVRKVIGQCRHQCNVFAET